MSSFKPMPDEKEFMSYLLGDVFKKITNGGDPKMLGPNNFIAWEPVPTVWDKEAFDYAAKGFFGSPPAVENMSDEDYAELRATSKYGKYAQSYEFAMLADQLPSIIPDLDENGARKFTIFNPDLKSSKSGLFKSVLENCKVLDSKEDPKKVKKLNTLKKKIFKIKKLKNPEYDDSEIEHPEDNPKYIYQSFYTPQYQNYLMYEALYEEAEETLTDLQKRVNEGDSEAMTEMAINGRNIIRKRDMALRKFKGISGSIEKALNYMAELEGNDFLTLKKSYESEFLAAKRTSLGGMSTYYYSAPIPANTLKNSSKWLKYSFQKSKYESSYKSTAHSWDVKAKYADIIGVEGEGKHSKIDSSYNFNDFHISFKIGKCFVSSPWFSPNFLSSGYWTVSKQGEQIFKNQMISDGNGGGLMPAVTTELYFITDLDIGFKKGSDSYKKVENQIKAGVAVTIGPFNLGGGYGYSDERVDTSTERENQAMSSDGGILLLGRKCYILDKCPNPLPSIKEEDWV